MFFLDVVISVFIGFADWLLLADIFLRNTISIPNIQH